MVPGRNFPGKNPFGKEFSASYSYQKTECSIFSFKIISVGELSVSEMYCRRNIRVVGETPVREIFVGELSVDEMSGRRNVCRRDVCRRNVLVPSVLENTGVACGVV